MGVVFGLTLIAASCGDDGDTQTETSDDPESGAESEGNEEGAAAAGEPADACGLLDTSDVEPYLGTVGEPEGEDGNYFGQGSYTVCTWERTDDEDGVSSIAVSVIVGEDVFANYDEEIYTPEPIEGLGDRAVAIPSYTYATGGGTGTSVIAEQGDTVVIVGAGGSVGFELGDESVTPNENPDLESLMATVLDGLA